MVRGMTFAGSFNELSEVGEGVIADADGTELFGVVEVLEGAPAFHSVDCVLWVWEL